jgi:hypothetical protein
VLTAIAAISNVGLGCASPGVPEEEGATTSHLAAAGSARDITDDMFFQNSYPRAGAVGVDTSALRCPGCGPTSTWTLWQDDSDDVVSYQPLTGGWTVVAPDVWSVVAPGGVTRSLQIGMPGSSMPGLLTQLNTAQYTRWSPGRCRDGQEPWPQFLLLEDLPLPGDSPTIVGYQHHIVVDMELQMHFVNNLGCEGYDPQKHPAYYTVVLRVESNEAINGTRQAFWFSMPLYDTRYANPPGGRLQDQFGDYIYTVPETSVAPGVNFGDGKVHAVLFDAKEELTNAINACHEDGRCASGSSFDFHLSMINIGWETLGRWNFASTLSHLRVDVD